MLKILKYDLALQVPSGAYLSNEKSQIIQQFGHWEQKVSSRQLSNGKTASEMNYRRNCTDHRGESDEGDTWLCKTRVLPNICLHAS